MYNQLVAVISREKIVSSEHPKWTVYDNIPLVVQDPCKSWCNILMCPCDVLPSAAFEVFGAFRPLATTAIAFVEV